MSAALATSAVVSPDRELQASLPILEDALRGALRRVRTRMLGRSGVDTPIRLASTRILTVGELVDEPEVRDGAAWSGFTLDRANIAGFSVIEGKLLARLVGRLFGDAGPGAAASWEPRSTTEVELKVATRLCDEIYSAIEANWPTKPAPRLVSNRAMPTRHGVAEMSMGTSIVGIVLECGTADDPLGTLTVALPVMLLRGLGVVAEQSGSQRFVAQRKANYDRVLSVELEMVIELARVKLRFGSLAGLKVGDEIPLPPMRECTASVNGRLAFFGEAGAAGGVRSFRVQKRCGGDSSPA